MSLHSWVIYIGFVLIATSTPGPAVLFIVSNSILHGKKKAVFAALGNITGLLCLGIISISGLGTILTASQVAFNVIKYFGATYLIYLGFKMFFQNGSNTNIINSAVYEKNNINIKTFFKALGVAISNPKAIIFLTALFPQFLNVEKELLHQFILLISTLLIFSFSFLMIYGTFASYAKQWLLEPKRFKVFNKIGGSVFFAFGVLLAISSK